MDSKYLNVAIKKFDLVESSESQDEFRYKIFSEAIDDAYWLRQFACAAMQGLIVAHFIIMKDSLPADTDRLTKSYSEIQGAAVDHARSLLAEIKRTESEGK